MNICNGYRFPSHWFNAKARNFILLIIAAIYLVEEIIDDGLKHWEAGGHPWLQADWLINYSAGLVRRGASGEVLFAFSDLIGANVLAVTISFQVFIALLVVAVLLFGLVGVHLADRVFLCVLSPLCLLGWLYESDNFFFRKEVLFYAAFCSLIISAATGRAVKAAAVFAVSLACISMIFHEGLVFLAPFLILVLFIHFSEASHRVWFVSSSAIIGVVAVATVLFAFAYPTVEEPDIVCSAVTDRGLEERICGGAIDWLGFEFMDPGQPSRPPLREVNENLFILAYVLGLVPFGFALQHHSRAKTLVAIVAGSGLILLPLYIIALDWGRWASMHIFSVSFVMLFYALKVRPDWLLRPLPALHFWGLVFLSFLWGMETYLGSIQGGVID